MVKRKYGNGGGVTKRAKYMVKDRGDYYSKNLPKRMNPPGRRTGGYASMPEYKTADRSFNLVALTQFQQDGAILQPNGGAGPSGVGTQALNAAPVGTASNERVGRRAIMKTLLIRGDVTGTNRNRLDTNIESWPMVRMIVFVDTQNNLTTKLNVLSVILGNGGVGSAGYGPRDMGSTARFKVIKDKLIRVGGLATAGFETSAGDYRWSYYFGSKIEEFIRIPEYLSKTYYTGDTASATSINTNALYFALFACNSTESEEIPLKFSGHTRVAFVDP